MSTYHSLFSSRLCLTWSVRVGLQFCRRRRHLVPTARSRYTASCGTVPGHWATAMQGYKSDDNDDNSWEFNVYSTIVQLYHDRLALLLLPKADDRIYGVRTRARKGGHIGESNPRHPIFNTFIWQNLLYLLLKM